MSWWWRCLPSAGCCAVARTVMCRRALPSGWGWSRWCWRWRPPGPVGSWWSGWASGSTRAPTWTRPAPCPARPPPAGHPGPSSPSRGRPSRRRAATGASTCCPPAASRQWQGGRNMTSHQQPQPKDLSTAERLKMTLGAVAQGIRYTLKGEHQTEGKAQLTVELEDVERIVADWPAPQQNVARQLLAKYGPPNEATPTRLFWHHNRPWKRTELTSDAVVHHWPAPHTDFLTPVPRLPGPTRAGAFGGHVRWQHPGRPDPGRGGRPLRLGGGQRARPEHGPRTRHRET